MRANKVASEEILTEINELRKRNAELEQALADLQPAPAIEGLAGLDEEVTIPGRFHDGFRGSHREWEIKTTWRKIFGYISPYLVEHPNERSVKTVLTSALFAAQSAYSGTNASIDEQTFKTVAVQLQALGLVRITYAQTTVGGMAPFGHLLLPVSDS